LVGNLQRGTDIMSLNLGAILRQSAALYPDRIALTHGESRIRYRQLHEAAQRFAGGLRRLGVRPGENVALMLPNVPQFTIAYFGAHYAACPVVPLNVLFTADDVAYHLADSDASVFVVWDRFLPQVASGISRAPSCKHVVVARAREADPRSAFEGSHDLADLLDAEPVLELANTSPDDTALLLYTSGTTGRAKGAELSHANALMNSIVLAKYLLPISHETVALACLPLFHSMGQTAVHNTVLQAGGKLVLMQRFEPRTALELIERWRVTMFCGVPTMYVAMLREIEAAPSSGDGAWRPDVSSLSLCLSGGSSIPVEVMRAFDARFNVNVLEGYGLSECSPCASFNQLSRPKKPGSIGVPVPWVEMRLVRPDGSLIVEPGERGEICVKGHNVMKGYYRKPEDTERAIRDGWLHTGDVGVRDDDGYYYVVDRIKDMIIRGGLNVYPREIEEVLYQHPAVAEAAVIGIPDELQGEEIKAFVVAKPAAAVTEQDIISYCRERLAVYKYPRVVELRASLPKGATGKILKKDLQRPG
jgi:long-chain acyl-CoA synthetase